MQKMRKSLSALLAVVMLISVFSFAASAGVDPIDSAATQNIAMKLEVEHADGTAATTVEPGETVTVNVYVTAKNPEARIYGGAFLIFWNSNIYTYVEGSRTWGLPCVNPESLYDISNTQSAYTDTVAAMTTDELGYGWDIAGNFQVKTNAGTSNTNADLIQAGSATPFISIKLKVSEDVTPGTSAPIGIPVTSIAPKNTTRMNYTYIQTWTAASKTVTQNKSKSLYVMDTIAALSVATPAPAGPALTHEGRQVKMTVVDNAVVSGTEQLRVVSSISNDDWNAYFANTTDKAATTDKIVDVGFVAYKGQASTFNADTAKNVAKGTATDSNYTVATTDYIQNTGSGYRFGARVDYKTAVYDTTYLAFVHYKDNSGNDAYVFYDTSTIYSLDFASNYDTITSNYIAFLNS